MVNLTILIRDPKGGVDYRVDVPTAELTAASVVDVLWPR